MIPWGAPSSRVSMIGELEAQWEPLVGEPLVGLRCWKLEWSLAEVDWRLRSISHEVVWPTGAPLKAECLGPRQPQEHQAPAEGISHICGIYATKPHATKERLRWFNTAGRDYRRVVGEVFLWGRIVVCTDGYRAEYAYPKSLVVASVAEGDDPVEIAVALEAAYGVPATVNLGWAVEVSVS